MSPEYQRSLIVNAVRIKYTLDMYEYNSKLLFVLDIWQEKGELSENQWANLEHYINDALGLDQ